MDVGRYFEPIAHGIANTLVITFASFALGLILAVPLALGRISGVRPVAWTCNAYIEALRAIPPLAWIFLVYFGVGSQVVPLDVLPAAIVSLGLITSAYMAEIYRAAIQSVPRGQWEAARALGLTETAVYTRVVLRQAVVVVIPPATTFLIGLLKDSSLASVIGVAEITARAYEQVEQTFQGLEVFLVAAVYYIALSVPLAALSRYLDRTLRLHVRA